MEEEEEELVGPEKVEDDRCLQSLYVRVREHHLHEDCDIHPVPPFGEYRTKAHLSSYLLLPPPTDC